MTIEEMAQAVQEIGAEHFILGSDLGQTGNPSHPDGYEALVLGFHAAGIGPDELDMMMVRNPARLLGLSVEN